MKDKDAIPEAINPDNVNWHSAAIFISDNVATQIDGLATLPPAPIFIGITASRNRNGGATGALENATRQPFRRSSLAAS